MVGAGARATYRAGGPAVRATGGANNSKADKYRQGKDDERRKDRDALLHGSLGASRGLRLPVGFNPCHALCCSLSSWLGLGSRGRLCWFLGRGLRDRLNRWLVLRQKRRTPSVPTVAALAVEVHVVNDAAAKDDFPAGSQLQCFFIGITPQQSDPFSFLARRANRSFHGHILPQSYCGLWRLRDPPLTHDTASEFFKYRNRTGRFGSTLPRRCVVAGRRVLICSTAPTGTMGVITSMEYR